MAFRSTEPAATRYAPGSKEKKKKTTFSNHASVHGDHEDALLICEGVLKRMVHRGGS